MTAPVPVAAPLPVPPQEDNRLSFSGLLSTFGRLFFIYFIISSFVGNRFSGSPPSTQVPQSQKNNITSDKEITKDGTASSSSLSDSYFAGYNPLLQFPTHLKDGTLLPPHSSLFTLTMEFELRVYVSETPQFSSFQDESKLVWHEQNLSLDFLPSNERSISLNHSVSTGMLQNSTVYAHIYITRHGFTPNPNDPGYLSTATIHKRFQLNTFRPSPKKLKTRNLLEKKNSENSEETTTTSEEENSTYLSHWIPSLIINPVSDFTLFPRQSSPPPFYSPLMQFDPESGNYFPVVYLNDFWVLEEHLLPINSSVHSLPLDLSFYPISITKLALYVQTAMSFENQNSMGSSTKKDSDQLKKLLTDTNPILLGITMCVSVLHSLFDFLAFKNDVSFWKNQKSLEGLSVRTIALNAFFQLIIFLYLLDNETSYMILISSGIGFLIELWKIKKAVKISYNEEGKLQFSGSESYVESSTALYDRIAISHLSFIMYPLVIGYAAYSLMYGMHKGWYSWILSSLTGFVYAFGFIMMTPQLYINYRMKSVAHLPWRAMVYKSLNTFIDDLFAFVITMPIMHRLSCFRDDIIFFIYLYQRWIYPVDKQRVNEFGQVGESSSDPSNASNASSQDTTVTTSATSAVPVVQLDRPSENTAAPAPAPVVHRSKTHRIHSKRE